MKLIIGNVDSVLASAIQVALSFPSCLILTQINLDLKLLLQKPISNLKLSKVRVKQVSNEPEMLSHLSDSSSYFVCIVDSIVNLGTLAACLPKGRTLVVASTVYTSNLIPCYVECLVKTTGNSFRVEQEHKHFKSDLFAQDEVSNSVLQDLIAFE